MGNAKVCILNIHICFSFIWPMIPDLEYNLVVKSMIINLVRKIGQYQCNDQHKYIYFNFSKYLRFLKENWLNICWIIKLFWNKQNGSVLNLSREKHPQVQRTQIFSTKLYISFHLAELPHQLCINQDYYKTLWLIFCIDSALNILERTIHMQSEWCLIGTR